MNIKEEREKQSDRLVKIVDNNHIIYNLKQRVKKLLHADDITLKKRSRLLLVSSDFSLALYRYEYQQNKLVKGKHG